MTASEYEKQQKRLSEIEKSLEKMAKDDGNYPNISTVINLRDEAREIVKNLNQFIQENFKN